MRACRRATWRAALRRGRVSAGDRTAIDEYTHEYTTDAAAARPYSNTIWLRPQAALGSRRSKPRAPKTAINQRHCVTDKPIVKLIQLFHWFNRLTDSADNCCSDEE